MSSLSPYRNRYVNSAIRLAARNPRALMSAASTIYRAGTRMYNNYTRSAPRTTPSYPSTTTTRTRFVGPRVISSQYRNRRTTTRMRRVYSKKKKINRLVGRPTSRRNVYNRRSKRMRTANTGKLNLQQRLQNGGALPNTTYARMFWRGSKVTSMLTKHRSITDTTSVPGVQLRSFTLNDLSSSPSFMNTDPALGHEITYAPMWKSLYDKYQVMGASFQVKINPAYYPGSFANVTNNPNGNYDWNVPQDAQPGYWYIRAYYHRSAPAAAGREPVGHPIERIASSVDPMKENLWPNLREFLADPTVTYKKDSTNIRTKLHIHTTQNILSNDLTATLAPSSGASYEIETATKPVILKCNFSAKKHFQDKNPLRNQPFNSWNSNLSEDYSFNIRFGYIGFTNDGNVAYHLPIDRNQNRFCEFEIQYFVALRDPKITPHQQSEPLSPNMMAHIPDDAVLGYKEIDTDDESDYIPEPLFE